MGRLSLSWEEGVGYLTAHEVEKLTRAHRLRTEIEAGIAEAYRLALELEAEAARA